MQKIFMCILYVVAINASRKLMKFDNFFTKKIYLNISIIVLSIGAICYIKELYLIANSCNTIAILLVLLSRIESQYFDLWLEWKKTSNESFWEKTIVFFGLKLNQDFLNFMNDKIKKAYEKRSL